MIARASLSELIVLVGMVQRLRNSIASKAAATGPVTKPDAGVGVRIDESLERIGATTHCLNELVCSRAGTMDAGD